MTKWRLKVYVRGFACELRGDIGFMCAVTELGGDTEIIGNSGEYMNVTMPNLATYNYFDFYVDETSDYETAHLDISIN